MKITINILIICFIYIIIHKNIEIVNILYYNNKKLSLYRKDEHMTGLESILKQSIIDNHIPSNQYAIHNVKKGLRNEDHTGVLIGLTKIADVVGYERVDGKKIAW